MSRDLFYLNTYYMAPDNDINSIFLSPPFLSTFFKWARTHWKNIFIIFDKNFFSIVWWLYEELGFVASWNKSIIAKWRSVEFFSMIWIFSVWSLYYHTLTTLRILIYSQIESFPTHLLWREIYIYAFTGRPKPPSACSRHAAGIRLGLIYLRGVQDYLRSLQLS